ncbi:MAG: DUF4398 domain-containing protein [bacterium]|nr:DUF4398 domain-containing protein [bacterium]
MTTQIKWIRLGIMLSICSSLIACASLPQKELDDARKAIMESEKINAVKYAPDELQSAKSFLDTAENQVKQKENKQAKENALKSKAMGDKAYYMAIEQFVKDQNEGTAKSMEEAKASHADIAAADQYQDAEKLYSDVQKDMEKLKVLSLKLKQEESLKKPE